MIDGLFLIGLDVMFTGEEEIRFVEIPIRFLFGLLVDGLSLIGLLVDGQMDARNGGYRLSFGSKCWSSLHPAFGRGGRGGVSKQRVQLVFEAGIRRLPRLFLDRIGLSLDGFRRVLQRRPAWKHRQRCLQRVILRRFRLCFLLGESDGVIVARIGLSLDGFRRV